MPWRQNFLAIDTETTGFGLDARIIEIALVRFHNGVVADKWSTLLYPEDVNWDDDRVKQALDVNKIKYADLEHQPQFKDIKDELLDRLSEHMVWVAHNAEFDLRMIQQELDRFGELPLPQSLVLDTMSLDYKIHQTPTAKGAHVVAAVASRWQVAFEGEAHRAAADAAVCGHILWKMLQKGVVPAVYEEAQAFQKSAALGWKNAPRPGRPRR